MLRVLSQSPETPGLTVRVSQPATGSLELQAWQKQSLTASNKWTLAFILQQYYSCDILRFNRIVYVT